MLTLTSEELADLDRRLREKILALVPRSRIARVETDHEALLEAQVSPPDGTSRTHCASDSFDDFDGPQVIGTTENHLLLPGSG